MTRWTLFVTAPKTSAIAPATMRAKPVTVPPMVPLFNKLVPVARPTVVSAASAEGERTSGETLLIGGPSGAGKSTLAAAIAGLLGTLLPGTLRGGLSVGGVDLVAAASAGEAGPPRELLSQLGYVAAGPAPRHALPRLLDDVALPLESRSLRADLLEAHARDAIRSAGLSDDAAERDVSSLSGGERAQAALDDIVRLAAERPVAW